MIDFFKFEFLLISYTDDYYMVMFTETVCEYILKYS